MTSPRCAHVGDDIGAAGVTFEHAFASVPECCPSRASLLTGQYAHNHGVTSNEPPEGGFNAFADESTLPVWLEDAGYRTGYVGKYLNGYGWEALDNDPPMSRPGGPTGLRSPTTPSTRCTATTSTRTARSSPMARSRPTTRPTCLRTRPTSSSAPVSTPATRSSSQVAPAAPHDEGVLEGQDVPRNPRPAPRHEGRFESAELPRGPSFNEPDVEDKPRFLRNDPQLTEERIAELEVLYRSRLESLLSVDELVHELATTLRRAGELDETVFIFTSDNGFMLGEHRQVGKEKVYEESAGVPLVIAGPGFSGGVSEEAPVSNVDLVATIVEQSGVEPGVPQDGVALAPIGPGKQLERAPILIEMLALREFAAIRTADAVYAEYEKGGSELYDLVADPAQLDNLRRAPGYRELRAELARELDALRDCAGRSAGSTTSGEGGELGRRPASVFVVGPRSRTVEQVIARAGHWAHGVVTRPELLADGVTPAEIRYRLRCGSLIGEYPGVYRVGHRAPEPRGALPRRGPGMRGSDRPLRACRGVPLRTHHRGDAATERRHADRATHPRRRHTPLPPPGLSRSHYLARGSRYDGRENTRRHRAGTGRRRTRAGVPRGGSAIQDHSGAGGGGARPAAEQPRSGEAAGGDARGCARDAEQARAWVRRRAEVR